MPFGGRQQFGDRNDRNNSTSPVSVGQELDVRIEAVGEKGDGIAKHKGFVLFVAGTKVGENVRIRVTKVLQKVGFADKIGAAVGKQESSHGHSAPAKEAEPEESYEDSEDFGEEDEEEQQ